MQPRNVSDRLPKLARIKNGDELRNINSFEYLAYLAEKIPPELQTNPIFTKVMQLCGPHADYNRNVAYGDLYTKFLLDLERVDLDALRQTHIHTIKLSAARFETYDNLLFSTGLEVLRDEKAGKKVSHLIEQTRFFKTARDLSTRQNKEASQQLSALDDFIERLYSNPNQALERSYGMVENVLDLAHQTSSAIENAITNVMKGDGNQPRMIENLNYLFRFQDKNQTTPQEAGSLIGRLRDMLSKNYKPQTTTSLASIRTYEHQAVHKRKARVDQVEGDDIHVATEIRFGTQGQLHKGNARVTPMFKSWLQVQASRAEQQGKLSESGISHVYFNNLGYDRTGYEGERERNLSLELHNLENDPNLSHLAVITLPADKGLMDVKMLQKNEASINYAAAKERMLAIALNQPDAIDTVKDFVISPKIKALLYKGDNGLYSADREREVLTNLLDKSFQAMGFQPGDRLSEANLQAVYFHFIKYEVTNYIIETLKPASFNMSCKDAIDRGGVSSAYYNLMASIDKGVPMSKEEFNRALHAAPTLVKGRGMNHHTQLIWNCVDRHVKTQAHTDAPAPEWMREWRDKNAPKYSKQYFYLEVEKYIVTRDQDPRLKFGFFGKENKEDKVGAAKKLRDMLDGKEVTFSKAEITALTKDSLGKLYSEIQKQGFVSPLKRQEPEPVTQHSMKVK